MTLKSQLNLLVQMGLKEFNLPISLLFIWINHHYLIDHHPGHYLITGYLLLFSIHHFKNKYY